MKFLATLPCARFFSPRIVAEFAVVLVSILIVGGLSIWSTLRLTAHAAWVDHSTEVIGTLSALLEAVRDDSSNQRAYIITGDESLLVRVDRARARSLRRLEEVRHLTADNATQQQKLAPLKMLIEERFRASQDAIDDRRAGDFSAAQEHVRHNLERNLQGQIATAVQAMQADEIRLRELRAAQAHRSTVLTIVAVSGGVILGLVTLCGSFYLIHRNLRLRHQAESEVRTLNATLEERVRQRTAELVQANRQLRDEMLQRRRLEREMLDFSEREQRRLGQELHDDLGQQLNAIGMLAYILKCQLKEDGHPAQEDAARLMDYISEAHQASRKLAKGFCPVELERGGFKVALEDLAARTRVLTKKAVGVDCDEDFPVNRSSGLQLYRIIQEAVNNAVKHARAETISIACRVEHGAAVVHVINDGVPFQEPARTPASGMGLDMMRYRANAIGATLHWAPGAQGGCEMVCRLDGRSGAVVPERPEAPIGSEEICAGI